MPRTIDCECGQQLRAETDELLLRVTKEHVATRHPEMKATDGEMRRLLADRAVTEGSLADRKTLNLARRIFHEVYEDGNTRSLGEIFTADYVNHDPAAPEVPPGPAGVATSVAVYKAGFPDHKFTLYETIATGDKILVRWSVSGTHTGRFGEIAPTNKKVMVSGLTLFRIEAGKIAESWAQWDTLGLLQQLGAISAIQKVHA